MRILKDPDVRRAEILDMAEQLFTVQGYAKTTIMDILNGVGIAKGTFYYYFKSKEEVMDAVIARIVEKDVLEASRIAKDNSLSPLEKFFRILMQQQPEHDGAKEKILDQIHQPNNAEMRQKSLVLGIQGIAPILAKVVEEGIVQGLFSTPYPRESVDILLAAGQLLFDRELFSWNPEERALKVTAFLHTVELLLGAPSGSFAFVKDILS